MNTFKDIGYYIEYCVDGKLIGTLLVDNPDRDEVGYYSRIDAIADTDIKLQRNKIIKKGTKYYTRLYPLCGQKI
jgi:hypothetical protein